MNISLIIPVYNAAPFIRKSVHSALQQSEVREIILVEDGSTDDSLRYCAELAAQETRVHLLRHPDHKNHGAGASRNLGLRHAKYPFIAFLDADDYFLPDRFKTTKEVFVQYPDADGVYEATERIFDNEKSRSRYIDTYSSNYLITLEAKINPLELFEIFFTGKKGWIHLNGLVLKRDVLQGNIVFDTQLLQTQDTDFILQLCLEGIKLYPGTLIKPVAVARIHGDNRILNDNDVREYRFLLFHKWFHKLIHADWSKQLNRHITRGLLYNHPMIRHIEKIVVLRVFLKTILLLILLIKNPRLINKLLL